MPPLRVAAGSSPVARNAASPQGRTLHWQLAPRWVFLLSIAGYPIVAAATAALGIANRPVSIAFRAVILALAVGAILRTALYAHTRWDRAFWIPWWIFWIAYVLRMTFDTLAGFEARNLPGLEYWSFALGAGLIPALAMAHPRLQVALAGAPRQLIRLAMIGLLANAWVIFFNGGLLQVIEATTLRAASEFLDPISLGHLGVTLFLLCAWQLVSPGEHGYLRRLFLVVGLFLAAGSLVASGSRGPVVSLAVGLAALMYFERRRLARGSMFVLSLLGILGVVLLYSQVESLLLFERLAGGAFHDETREQLMAKAWELFQDSPVVGAGIDPMFAYPHNLVIEAFMSGGIVTGLTFAYLVLYALHRSLTNWRSNRAQSWVTLLYLQYLSAAMVSGSLYSSSVLWILSVAVVSLKGSGMRRLVVSGNGRDESVGAKRPVRGVDPQDRGTARTEGGKQR